VGSRIYVQSTLSNCQNQSASGPYFAKTTLYIVYSPPTGGTQTVYTAVHNGTNYIINNVSQCTPTIDGYTYPTVIINNKTWFSENLKTTINRGGNSIMPYGAYYVNNNSSNTTDYGLLYVNDNNSLLYLSTGNNELNSHLSLCPAGWHIPTDTEFTDLITFLGGSSIAGGKMKETGLTYWDSPNTGADNSSGFKGRGAGFFNSPDYISFKVEADYWTTTPGVAADTYYSYSLRNDNAFAQRYAVSKYLGFSARCIRN